MIDNSKEYILCAAVKRLDGGFDCGYRHNDVYESVPREDIEKIYGIDFFTDMGFLTSKERFVDRYEAWRIAKACGQVEGKGSWLASEDLY